MSKYSDASFILPQGAYRKAGEIELLKPTDNLLNLKVSRNAPCDEINSLGESVEVAADVPRYDFKAPYVPPVDNSNYSYNGINDNCVIQNSINLNFGSGSFSLEFWCRPDKDTIGVYTLVDKRGGSNEGYEFSFDGSKFKFLVDGGGAAGSVLSNNVSINQWYHVVGVFNGVDLKIYIDGVLHNTVAYTITTTTNSNDFFIGVNAGSNYWEGGNKNMFLYNLEIDATYVLDRYNGLPIPEKYKGANNVIFSSGTFVVGKTYRIVTSGVTDFTLIGAPDSNVGTEFTATGSGPFGAGQGTARSIGNTLNLSTGKTDTTWYDRQHDIQAVITGATLNDSTDFGNNFHGVKTCPSLLTEPLFKNYFFNSRTPVSQTVSGLTPGIPFTVNCKGAGIIIVSEPGGNGVGGVATEVYHYTYVPTQTSVVLTLVAGHSFDWVMVTDTSYPMNHLETLGASVTKPVDAVTGGGDVNTYNSLEGVLYIESRALMNDGSDRYVSLNDGTANNRVDIRYSPSSNEITCAVFVAGVNIISYATTSFDILSNNKIAINYKSGDYAAWVNGVLIGASLNISIFAPNTLNDVSFNRWDSSNNFTARTEDLLTFNESKTSAELQILTTL